MLETRKFLRQKKKLRKAYNSQGVKNHDTWKRIKNGLNEKIAGLGRSSFVS